MGIDNIPKDIEQPFRQRDVRRTNAGGIVQTNFNTDDFDVTDGVVNLKNKTSYYSISGTKFRAIAPDIQDVGYNSVNGAVSSSAADNTVQATVELPHGAVVTAFIVYGNAGAEAGITCTLQRVDSSLGTAALASAAVGTEDTSISNATIDNQTYNYLIIMGAGEFDSGDQIRGARITYTTDYD